MVVNAIYFWQAELVCLCYGAQLSFCIGKSFDFQIKSLEIRECWYTSLSPFCPWWWGSCSVYMQSWLFCFYDFENLATKSVDFCRVLQILQQSWRHGMAFVTQNMKNALCNLCFSNLVSQQEFIDLALCHLPF